MSRLDDVLADIQTRVERRRAAGDYPADLEQRLADHGARTALTGSGGDLGALHPAVDAVSSARRFDPGRIPTTSRHRAGSAAHRALALAMARPTAGILSQVGEFAERVEAALRLIVERLEAPGPYALLAAQVDAALDRLAQSQQPLDERGALADLRDRVEALEGASSAGRTGTAWWDAVRWVNALDGPFDQVVALRSSLAQSLDGPVLDLSCRRGELLWALGERQVESRGAEADARLAATAAGAGLAVAHAGPLVTLARAADGSLGAVVALGIAGRLGPQGTADLVALAADKLRFGGKLIVESDEPDDPAAWAEPGSARPVAPSWVTFACEEVRFRRVRLERAGEAPAGARPGCYLVTATK